MQIPMLRLTSKLDLMNFVCFWKIVQNWVNNQIKYVIFFKRCFNFLQKRCFIISNTNNNIFYEKNNWNICFEFCIFFLKGCLVNWILSLGWHKFSSQAHNEIEIIFLKSHIPNLVFYLKKKFQKIMPKFEIVQAYLNSHLSPKGPMGL